MKVTQQNLKEPTAKEKENKLKTAIKLLNRIVAVKLAPSNIHGVGVFATRDIKKGEILELDGIPHQFDVPFERFGELRPEIREILLSMWPQIVNGSHFLYPVTRMQAFLNHSDMPNYNGKTDTALRKIKKGEEITEDYRLIDGWEKVYRWLK